MPHTACRLSRLAFACAICVQLEDFESLAIKCKDPSVIAERHHARSGLATVGGLNGDGAASIARIEQRQASIESQLRSGALNAGPEGGQVVHGTVQLVYALVFGTFGPMLQSVFNLTVLHKRSFQYCQSVMCTISGAMTRLFGGWAHTVSYTHLRAHET